MKPEDLEASYWNNRQKIIQGLKDFKVSINAIGNMTMDEQRRELQRLKESPKEKISSIVTELINKYEDM